MSSGQTLSILLLLCLVFSSQQNVVQASTGSPFYHHRWGVASISSPPLSPKTFPFAAATSSSTGRKISSGRNSIHDNELEEIPEKINNAKYLSKLPPRGGQGANTVVRVVSSVTEILVQCGRLVLPPTAALVKLIADIYRVLPKDAIIAQVGLVYCFAGGYYPTLFSSLQAAQHCGWNVMVAAIQDLTDEALRVIHALEDVNTSQFGFEDDEPNVKRQRARSLFRRRTSAVLATVCMVYHLR